MRLHRFAPQSASVLVLAMPTCRPQVVLQVKAVGFKLLARFSRDGAARSSGEMGGEAASQGIPNIDFTFACPSSINSQTELRFTV